MIKRISAIVAVCVLGLATAVLSVLLIVNAGMNGYSPYGDTAANKLDAAAEYSAAAMMPKIADIGIGMGITGTDVTKSVADMVLADDNFATIVTAVKEGRRIYSNIQKSIQFLISSNISEVLSIFIATVLNFSILSPIHILWINLITDTFPALSLGMEKEESNLMKSKPRPANEGIFANGLSFDITYQGILISIIALASYFIGHYLET